MSATTTLKLSDDLRARIAPLARAAGKTTHAWMVEALEAQAALAEMREQEASDARKAIDLIVDAVVVLDRHPHVGRPLRGPIRELVISRGRTGYVALYRVRPALDRGEILAIRHQREAGYSA